MPDTLGGLPLHPLVVHAVVVLLPLSAIGALLLVAVPRWRRTYGPLVLIGLAVSTASAFVAKETGEQLAMEIGITSEHRDWGDRLLPIAAVLLVVFAAWWFRARNGVRSAITSLAAAITAIVAVGAIGATIVTGHSGAEAAWADTVDASAPSPAATVPAALPLTLEEVAKHATPDDCWAAVGGSVYDLTGWIARHPGGPATIEALCGTDATAAFQAEHGGEGEPAAELAAFRIGELAG